MAPSFWKSPEKSLDMGASMQNNWSVSVCAPISKSPNSCGFTGNGECAHTRNRSSLGFFAFLAYLSGRLQQRTHPGRQREQGYQSVHPVSGLGLSVWDRGSLATSGEDSGQMSKTRRSAAGSSRSQFKRASGLSDSALSPWGNHGQTY